MTDFCSSESAFSSCLSEYQKINEVHSDVVHCLDIRKAPDSSEALLSTFNSVLVRNHIENWPSMYFSKGSLLISLWDPTHKTKVHMSEFVSS